MERWQDVAINPNNRSQMFKEVHGRDGEITVASTIPPDWEEHNLVVRSCGVGVRRILIVLLG
jgi:hypothetical protein